MGTMESLIAALRTNHVDRNQDTTWSTAKRPSTSAAPFVVRLGFRPAPHAALRYCRLGILPRVCVLKEPRWPGYGHKLCLKSSWVGQNVPIQVTHVFIQDHPLEVGSQLRITRFRTALID
jgi:hypothetical protein